jgi:hypothetical protein
VQVGSLVLDRKRQQFGDIHLRAPPHGSCCCKR